MKNKVGREIPENIEGIGKVELFLGAWEKLKKGWMDEKTVSPPNKAKLPHQCKSCSNLEAVIAQTKPFSGMTVSFHHHLRNGDDIVIRVLDILAKMGIKDITLSASSLNTVHDPIVKYIKDGTITKIWTSGLRGELGKAVSQGFLKNPVSIHSHGGRVRAIHTGKIQID